MKLVRRVKKPEQIDLFGGVPHSASPASNQIPAPPESSCRDLEPSGRVEASSGELPEATRPPPRPTRKVRRGGAANSSPGSSGEPAPSGDVASPNPTWTAHGEARIKCADCGADKIKIAVRAEGYNLITSFTCQSCGNGWGKITTRTDVCSHGVWIRVPCVDCGRTRDDLNPR